MASYYAIAAIGKAIQRLLTDARPKEFETVPVELLRAIDFSKDTPVISEGVSLYLYRVAANTTRRNMQPRRMPNDQRLKKPPLPLDLYFLLTPWAGNLEKQLRLLGWAMRTLDDTPILPTGLLNAPGPEPNIFGSNETVELIFDPLSLQDISILWENLKTPRVQPSVSYVARMVLLDSLVEIPDVGLVQTREFDLAKGPQ